MKKFLLLVAFSVLNLVTGYAQSLLLLDQGTDTINNHYIYVVGSASSSDIYRGLWVRNTTTDTLSVKVTRVEIDVTAGTLNATCWDICPPADTAGDAVYLTSGPTLTLNPGATEYSFSAHIYPENISGCSHFRYIFFATNNGAVMDSVDIYFNHGQVCSQVASTNNIEEAYTFELFPNPTSDYINVKLSDNIANGEILISNVLGTVISRRNISEMHGISEISVEGLNTGIYFMSVVSDNKTLSTRKFQIIR